MKFILFNNLTLLKWHNLLNYNWFDKGIYKISIRFKSVNSSTVVNYQIRALKVAEIPEIMERRKEMGSLDCQSCLQTFLKLDPEGINVAVHESGKIIGALSSMIYPENFVFVGMSFTTTGYRGFGIMTKLWDRAYQHTGKRNFGVHAVSDKIEIYQKIFNLILVEDFVCTKNVTPRSVNTNILSVNLPGGVSILSFQEAHLESMYAYDLNLMGYKRNLLLELSCKEENSKTFVALKDGVCVGFGTIKLNCLGHGRVGPLYADDAIIAEMLLKNLVESFPQGRGFSMVTVSNNLIANKLMEKLDVPATDNVTQMYSQRKVEVDTSKVFAIFDINGAPF